MKRVFISYKSEELAKAKAVAKYLEDRSIPCWMAPRNIPIGSNYAKEIPQAIRACNFFILMLSEKAQQSQWINREVSLAIGKNMEIMPLQLEACQLTDEYTYYLTNVQIYPLYEDQDHVLQEVVERICQMQGVSVPPIKPVIEPKITPPSQKSEIDQSAEPYVFINYSHKDHSAVMPIIAYMQEQGIRVWYDAGVDVGTDWVDNLAHHLNECNVFITFMSKHTVESINCRREINYAMELQKQMLVVHLEKTELPMGMQMQLSTCQTIFRERYRDHDEFMDALCGARILQQCH